MIQFRAVIAGSFLAAALWTTIYASAQAHEVNTGTLNIFHPYANASRGQEKDASVYMRLTNNGSADDVLLEAKTYLSQKVMLGARPAGGSNISATPLVGGITLPAGGVTRLEPGGLQVMLIGLNRPLKTGQPFPLTLMFANAGRVVVMVKVMGKANIADPHAQHRGSASN